MKPSKQPDLPPETADPERSVDEVAKDENIDKADLRKQRRERIISEATSRALKAFESSLKKRPPGPAAVVEVAPMAGPAKMRRRHWGLIFGFLIFVLLPIAVSGWYLWNRAVDQYASTVAFTVRQEQGPGPSDLLTGFAAQVSGSGNSTDTAILYEFIQSQGLVANIDATFDLRSHYGTHYDQDPIFALAPDATLEDLVDYWQRVIRVSFDEGSGLMELRVLAFEPEFAQNVAEEIVRQSQDLINGLNIQARADTLRYASADLEEAEERVRTVRSALTEFRTRTQLVDPETDLAGRLGVVNFLQQQLAEAYIEFDLLSLSTGENDPRVQQATQRIEVIRDRLAEERANVAGDGAAETGQDYPSLLAEYEGLLVDREFAEETYRAALAAVDLARANADRQSRYLAAYITPTLPTTPEYPQRLTLLGLVALFVLLTWSIVSLVYYSIRDSR
ncbi:MAG: sugar transporter [Pseudomonadota bacterium]